MSEASLCANKAVLHSLPNGMFLKPFSWLYAAVMHLRNKCFDLGLLPARQFKTPVICIGNLRVGGTGKTPHTEMLLRELLPSYPVAVLSRGYGRKTSGFLLADHDATASDIGDEPFQIYRKFPEALIAVDSNRCRGIEQLLEIAPSPLVVLLDDAFQHRYVRAGLYILLTERHRLYLHDHVLPEGRLREAKCGAKRADIVVVTKCDPAMTAAEAHALRTSLNLLPTQQLFFTAMRYGALYSAFSDATAPSLAHKSVLLLTGIANPEPLAAFLKSQHAHVCRLQFADHHRFSAADARIINNAFAELPPTDAVVVTTEKDAVRLERILHQLSEPLRLRLFVQPIEPFVLFEQEEAFFQLISDNIQQQTQ